MDYCIVGREVVCIWRSGAGAIELFTPVDSECIEIRDRMKHLFSDGGYFSDRTLLAPNLLILIVEAKNGLSVLDSAVVREYERLRFQLESMQVRQFQIIFFAAHLFEIRVKIMRRRNCNILGFLLLLR